VFSCSKIEQKQLNTWVSFQSAEQPLLGQFSVSGNNLSKGRAKALNHLAGWRKAQHQIDLVLLKQSAGQLCRHTRFAGTGRCLAEEVRRDGKVLQRHADAAELPVS